MINTLIRDQPGTRYKALALYSEHLLAKRHKVLRATLSRPLSKHLAQQNERDAMWSMDFMQDGLPSGARYWLLNVIDDFSREALIVKVLKRRSAKAVVEQLGAMSQQGRRPGSIRTDNGGEFKSVAYRRWTDANSIRRTFIRRRVPADNAYIERFNKTLRSEFLSRYTFRSLAEVQRALDEWSLRYNFVRSHLALGDLSPMQFLEVRRRSRRAH